MLRRLSLLLFIVPLLALACGSSNDNGFLQSQDLSLPDGLAFDSAELVSSQAFVDTSLADVATIQGFFEKTAYMQPSFLATYSSNGTTASLAVVHTAQAYRLNPIVLLAHAQRAQGLVGLRSYPQPATRVEFVFGCGCTAPGVCDATLGGFDRQLDCLGRALRTALDQIDANGASASGWAVGMPSRTIDGINVTPVDDSTAALYSYLPLLGNGKNNGEKLFFTIYQLYATALNYFDPGGASTPGGDGTMMGDPGSQM